MRGTTRFTPPRGSLSPCMLYGDVIDQRYVTEVAAVLTDQGTAIGGVHQIVETGDALSTERGGRQGDLRVMGTGGDERRADGDLAIDHIQMQLVSDPRCFEALAVGLAARTARLRQPGEHGGQGQSRPPAVQCGSAPHLGVRHLCMDGHVCAALRESRLWHASAVSRGLR